MANRMNASTRRVAVSTDRQFLAVPTQDPLLLLYDRATAAMRTRLTIPGPPGDVWPVGPLVVTALADAPTAVLVDPVAGIVARTLALPFVGNIVVDPTGATLVVFAEGRAALVDINDGRTIRSFTGGTRSAVAAALSSDRTLLAIGGDDQLITVWDIGTGELRGTLRGYAASVRGLAFSADGRSLYSASRDKTLIEWDLAGNRSFGSRSTQATPLPAPDTSTNNALASLIAPQAFWTGDRRQVYVLPGDNNAAAVIEVGSGRSTTALSGLSAGVDGYRNPKADLDRQVVYGPNVQGLLVS
jgi:WD40 repeat protein